MPQLVCFDCETAPFPAGWNGLSDAEKAAQAPALRICCTYDGKRWRDFTPDQAPKLIAHLQKADALLSYNGLRFDELVLRRHAGLWGASHGPASTTTSVPSSIGIAEYVSASTGLPGEILVRARP